MGVLLADAYWDVLIAHSDRLSVYDDGRIVKVFRKDAFDIDTLSALVRGPQNPPPRVAAAKREDPPALSFAGVCANTLQDISFQVNAGDVVSILDLDGSGNDQIVALLEGTCPLRSGEIRLAGAPYRRRSLARALRRGLGILSENPTHGALFHELSTMDNLALLMCGKRRGFFLSGRFMRSLREHCAEFLSEEVLDSPSLTKLDETMRRRLVYCRWLIFRPKVMVLLRPLSVADAPLSAMTHELIAQLAARGSAVLILSSNAMEAELLSRRVLILEKGQIKA
jgi:ribose transport system ATP-binding protein